MTLDESFADEADDLGADATEAAPITAERAARVTEFLARSLVDEPDGVEVDVQAGRDGDAMLVVRAAPGDVGRLIGRRGRTVQALRQVARAAAAADDQRIQLDVVD